MPKVSSRSGEILHSPIRSLMPYARQAKKKGNRVFHLNIGQPDIPTPENALTRLNNFKEKIIGYGASEGKKELRELVANYYSDSVAPISIDQVYATTGASEAILFSLFSCFDPGDEIIIPEPFYANYIGFSKVTGVKLVAVRAHVENGFRMPPMDKFEEKINPHTKAIFLCNPGNPTGCLYSKQELSDIGNLVRKKDIFLFVDEVYREFCYDSPFTSVLSLKGLEEHVVVIDSISKVFSACGARVGFIVSRNKELMKQFLKYAEMRLCPPMLGQIIAEACFTGRAKYLGEVKNEYNRRRLYLYDRLRKMPGVTCYLPEAAFYIMTGLPVEDAHEFCKWLLTDFSLDGKTVMLAPGSGFYLTPDAGKNEVRIAFILGLNDLQVAMDCLEEGLNQYTASSINKKQLSYS